MQGKEVLNFEIHGQAIQLKYDESNSTMIISRETVNLLADMGFEDAIESLTVLSSDNIDCKSMTLQFVCEDDEISLEEEFEF